MVTPAGCPVQDGTMPAVKPFAANVMVANIVLLCATEPDVGERDVVKITALGPLPCEIVPTAVSVVALALESVPNAAPFVNSYRKSTAGAVR